MMENAEGIAEIHRVCFERQAIDAALEERRVREGMEMSPGDLEGLRACVHTAQCSHSRCYETGPASGSATCIESSRVPWERIPWEQAEVLFEDSGEFLFVHIRLVKPRPFLSK